MPAVAVLFREKPSVTKSPFAIIAPAAPREAAAGAFLRIDLDAVVDNWRRLARHVRPARTAAVVKADAYGLGAERVAPVLYAAGCRDFFVAELAEALALRPVLGADAALYVLNGLMAGSERLYVEWGIRPVLNSLAQCRVWAALRPLGAPMPPAVLQVDTGMSRLGLGVDEQAALAADPALLTALGLDTIMSHLANADTPDHPGNAAQLAAFGAARARFPGLAGSLSASAGMMLDAEYHFGLCRPGAALYGIRAGRRLEGLRPVAELWARLAQLRTVEAGAHVGYGYTFRADRPMRLATISVGYADGWFRALSGVGAAWFEGHRLPIAGRVSMDSFSVDISALPEGRLCEGDLVELIGPHQSADDIADAAGTIGYEVLTSLGRRYRRLYG